ncbi:MAG: glutamate--cysteine ligase, partial [Myxococcaceae bacterium]|nr:glutamate--cysteine ligase [Myxococcaceae bacterium]
QREGLRAFSSEAKELVEIARRGLTRLGDDDPSLLDALDVTKSPAEAVLAAPRDASLLDRFEV